MRLRQKVAIITGAAGSLGAAQAELFAREGAFVVLTDMRNTEGHVLSDRLAAAGAKAVYRQHDVTDEDAWRSIVRETVSQFGRLDILVNNAGTSGVAEDPLDTAVWDRLMAVNAKGVFLGMKHAIATMRPAGSGAIVNISSTMAFGAPNLDFVHMGYSASKAACHLATKAAAIQNAKHGIRINSVHPGLHPPMAGTKASGDLGARQKLFEKVPMGREGRPEELAKAVLFLASDDASYITGTSLIVDGGWLASQ